VTVTVNPGPTAATLTTSGGTTICPGGTGNLVVNITGGTGPYNFTIANHGAVANYTSGTLIPVNPAATTSYSITGVVTDANGCTVAGTGTGTITVAPGLTSATLSTTTPAVCAGTQGVLRVTIVGGTAPYSFTLDNGIGAITGYTSGSNIPVSPAATSTYNIVGVVTDANGCTVAGTGSPSITVNPGLTSATFNAAPAAICPGGSANISVTIVGGTAPYSFNINNPNRSITGYNSGDAISVTPAATTTYSFINPPVTDANGCTVTGTGSVTVTVNPGPTAATLTTSGATTICPGGTGNLVVNITGGTGPYNFTIANHGAVTNYTSGTLIPVNPAATTTYSITGVVTDANGCTVAGTGSVSVIVNPPPAVANVAGGGTVCAGATLPNVTFTFTGTAPFNFTYTDGTTLFPITNHNSTTFTITNASAGNYSVTALSDATTCNATAFGGSVQVSVNPLPTATISGGGTVCTGSPLPDVTFTFTGTAPFDFTYTDGTTPQTVTGHATNSFTIANAAVGTYSVTALSDANTCAGTSLGTPVNVMTSPAPTVANVSGGGTVCTGATLPNVTFTFTGTAPFDFTYTDGTTSFPIIAHNSTSFTITNAPAGTYSVTALTDATTCAATVLGGSTQVILTPLPTATASGGGSACSTIPPDVTFTFTGTAPFDFTYTDGTTPQTVTGHNSNTFTITNAPEGTYSVTALTDASTCSATDFGSAAVVTPSSLVLSSPGDFVLDCAGITDGTATFTASGGTAPYTFVVTPPVGFTGNTALNLSSVDITGAGPGTYSVEVTDNVGCSTEETIIIGEPTEIVLSIDSKIDVTCSGLDNGEIHVSAGGGTPGTTPDPEYVFSKDNGLNFDAGTGDFMGLPPGDYDIVARDANGCISAPTTVTIDPGVTITVAAGAVNVDQDATCAGVDDGQITIVPANISGGTNSYVYSIDGETPDASLTRTDLAAGTHNLVVRDINNNCESTPFAFTINANTVITATYNPTPATCLGATDGTIEVIPDIAGTYEYSVDNGAFQTLPGDNIIPGLTVGNHDVVIRDQNSLCMSSPATVAVGGAATISATVTPSPTSCFGVDDGTIVFSSPTGGADYEYSINGGPPFQTNATFNGLEAKSYDVVIRERTSLCISAPQSVQVLDGPALIPTIGPNPADCLGGATGSIVVSNVTNNSAATPKYEYSLDNGLNWTPTALNIPPDELQIPVAAGTYEFIIRDVNNQCQSQVNSITVGDGPPMTANITVSQPSCLGQDGVINVTSPTGTLPFTYSIDNGVDNFPYADPFTLAPGTYDVTVKDKNGCLSQPQPVTVNPGTPIDLGVIVTNSTCDGTIEITVNGGDPLLTYQFSKDGGATFEPSDDPVNDPFVKRFIDVPAGVYDIVVMNDGGCSSSVQQETVAPTLTLTADFQPNDATCNGLDDGSITPSNFSDGGIPSDYQYSVDNKPFGGVSTLTGLAPKTYSIVISNADGCVSTPVDVVIGAGTIIAVDTDEVTDATCAANDGSIDVTEPTTGLGPYEYTVATTSNTIVQPGDDTFVGLAPGTYTIVIKDANGCQSAPLDVVIGLPPGCVGTCAQLGNIPITEILPTCASPDIGLLRFTLPSSYDVILMNKEFVADPTDPESLIFSERGAVVEFSGLRANRYTYRIKDLFGTVCTTADHNLALETSVKMVSHRIEENVTCYGSLTGSVVISASGTKTGTYFYSFVHEGNTIIGEFTPGVPIEGIPATDNDFLVIKIDETTNFLCPDTAMVKVQHIFPKILFNISNKTNVTKCGLSDGAFTIENLSGGAGSYQVRLVQETLTGNVIIRDFEPVPGTSFTYDNLASGSYIVVIQDLNLCTVNTESVVITAPGAIDFDLAKLRDTDCGADNQAKNGQIEILLTASGDYQIGLSNSQFDIPEPDQYVNLIYSLGDPNPTIDTLSRGHWFVFIKPTTGDNCPSVRDKIIDGAYALSFAPQRVCNLVGPAGLNLTDVIADPTGSNIIVNIYPSNDLSTPLEPVLVLPYSSVMSIDHIALQTPGDYVIEIQQNQALCMITSEKIMYTVAPAMSLVIEDITASLPEPRQTGGFVLKTVIGGLPLNGDDGLYYIGNLIDPFTGSVIEGPFDIVRNAQGNFERKFKNMPVGSYRLEVTDAYGCQVASVAIVPKNTDIIIPNIFTPNSDEINDLFEIVNLPESGKHKLVITNRWGKEMFTSGDYKEGNFWDAEDVPEGVYFYRLQISGGKTFSGWVEVVRGTKP
jgi:gliding motility-associated-like protein